MILNYQYRAYPDNSQKLELNYWRRVAQYWYNWQLGDRFQWWENSRNEILPVGIWQSDYLENIKRDKAIEKDKQEGKQKKRKQPTKSSEAPSCLFSCSLTPYSLRDNPGYFSQKKLLPKKKLDLIKVFHSGELLDFERVPSQTASGAGRVPHYKTRPEGKLWLPFQLLIVPRSRSVLRRSRKFWLSYPGARSPHLPKREVWERHAEKINLDTHLHRELWFQKSSATSSVKKSINGKLKG